LTFARVLGSGELGHVYLYESVSLGRQEAVKVFHEAIDPNAGASGVARVARTMARLEHPHIVPVYGTGLTDDGRPYVEMSFFPQDDLGDRLAEDGPFSVQDTVRIGIQLAGALATAHRAGVVHGDVRPANVLADEYGDPALTDFGQGAPGATAEWAAPEVRAGRAPDERSDVYSLAATLWTLLAGNPPPSQPAAQPNLAPSAASAPNLTSAPPHPNSVTLPASPRADVPQSLARLLHSAHATDPRLRPQTAVAFALGLQAVEDELALPKTALKIPRDNPAGPATLTGDTIRHHVVQAALSTGPNFAPPTGRPANAPRGWRRHRVWIIPLIALALLAGAGAVFWQKTHDYLSPPYGPSALYAFGFSTSIAPGHLFVESQVPVPVTLSQPVVDVAAAGVSVVAVLEDGTVWAWGGNGFGEAGDGTTDLRLSPAPIPGLEHVVAVAGALRSAYALTRDGHVYHWGSNAGGEAGDGTQGGTRTPTLVPGIDHVTAITAGTGTAYALRDDGTVWTWGTTLHDQSGDAEEFHLTPVQVPGLTNITKISAGQNSGLALATDGTVYVWGNADVVAAAGGHALSAPEPVRGLDGVEVEDIAIDGGQAFVVGADGSVWAWGLNDVGQMGDGTVGDRHDVPAPVPGLTGVVHIATSLGAVFATTAAGELWVWGSNGAAQLGLGDFDNRSTPAKVELSNVRAVSALWTQAYALTAVV
jgi:hypothetical protein